MVNLSGFYVAVVLFIAISTSISPSFTHSVVRDALQKTSRKNFTPLCERGNTPDLIATLYFGKQNDLWNDVV